MGGMGPRRIIALTCFIVSAGCSGAIAVQYAEHTQDTAPEGYNYRLVIVGITTAFAAAVACLAEFSRKI